MNVSCIILAAGSGKRFGKKKQFMLWKGKELWRHVKEQCKKVTNDIVVVGVDIKGGKYRQESVKTGLQHIKNKKVVILEAARPLVTSNQINTIAKTDYPSVSFVINSTDTIIYKGEILDRKITYRLQVPQAFDTDKLITAHNNTKLTKTTDDTIIMKEYYNIEPRLITGGTNLFKVTYPDDLKILEVLSRKL